MGFKNFLAQLVPTIAAAAGGPLAGSAAKMVEGALGIKIEPTQEGIEKAVAGATPDQLLALKQADQQFALQMAELGFKDEEALLK